MRKNWIAMAALALAVTVTPVAFADDDRHEHREKDDRGYLGVSLHFTESIHKNGEPVVDKIGVYLGQVVPGGPSDLAGLKKHDKIVALDGRTIDEPKALKLHLAEFRKGDTVAVTVERDGREETFDVVLGERSRKTRHVNLERVGALLELTEMRSFIGIESQEVGSQLARYFDVQHGVLVSKVIEGTPAEEAGLEAGDILIALDGQSITAKHDLHTALAKNEPGQRVGLTVSRRGAEMQFTVTLSSAKEHLQKMHPEGNVIFHERGEHADHINHGDRQYKVKVREKKRGGD